MSGVMNMLLGARTAIAAAVDEFFNRVTLLLPGDGTNGAQNNTFLDSSTNNFTITRNGNTTQGTFSPFSQTGWSNFFGGSGNYARTGTLTAIATTQSTFTVECWVYMTQTPTTPSNFSPTIGDLDPTGADANWAFGPMSNGKVRFYWWTGSANFAEGGTALALNTWYHIAASVSSNAISIYVNGVRETLTGTTTLTNRSALYNSIGFGQRNNGSDLYVGYVSNARIVSGAALYSGASFTVPTSPLGVAGSGTTQLLTCQSNRFLDNSSNAVSVTPTGSSTSVQAFSPFLPTIPYSAATVGGSGYFDGTGDFLTVASNAAFGYGTGNITIETWVYHTSRATIATIYASDTDNLNIFIKTSGVLAYYNGTSTTDTSATIALNAWTHIAFVRSGTGANQTKMYVNGVEVLSGTNSVNYATTAIRIGTNPGTAVDLMNGYISSFRIVKGTAVYTAAFTPPTAPVTDITNTSLLTNFTNAGITDATAKNDLETVGNAQISTTQSKFGGSSMYFDGNGDYLFWLTTANTQFGSGDFTIEFWVRATTTVGSGGDVIFDRRSAAAARGIVISLENDGRIYFYGGDTGTTSWEVSISTAVLNTGQWYHYAASRAGTTYRCFLDGTLQNSATNSVTLADDTSSTRIGAAIDNANYFDGYLDDLRVTKGLARYTANFSAPTAAFPLQ